MSEAAKHLLDRIEALDTAAADNRHRAETYQRMADELVQVHGRATSPDGLVTAVVTADGALQSIIFNDYTRTTSPATLAAAVLHTIATARTAATREQAEVVRCGLGDTELLDVVLGSDQRLFGDHRTAGPAPVRFHPREDENEETNEGFSVFGARSS